MNTKLFRILFQAVLFFTYVLFVRPALAESIDPLVEDPQGQTSLSSIGDFVPQIISITPANISKIYDTGSVAIAVDAADESGTVLYYKFEIDGQTVQDWSSANYYNWQLPAGSSASTHTLNVTVKNGQNRTASGQSKFFVIHKPIQPPIRPTPVIR